MVPRFYPPHTASPRAVAARRRTLREPRVWPLVDRRAGEDALCLAQKIADKKTRRIKSASGAA